MTELLLKLQNQLKRDPEGFKTEFLQQQRHFETTAQLFSLQSAATKNPVTIKEFASLIQFLSHAAPYYKSETAKVPQQLVDLLGDNVESLDPFIRRCCVQGLVMLQNRGMISRLQLLPTLFQLFRCRDKSLRKLLFSHIVNDIKRVNSVKQNHKLNNTLQNFMFTMLKDESTTAAKKSLDVMIELWRRRVWADAKTVNAIVTACFHKETKIIIVALHFFIGLAPIEEDEDDEKIENASKEIKELNHSHSAMKSVCKNRKKRQREFQRAQKKLLRLNQKAERECIDRGEEWAGMPVKKAKHSSVVVDVPAIQMIHDPQSFAERLFGQVRRSMLGFETKLLMLNVISRLVGAHKLILFNLYPFLQKYMQPTQRKVTSILTFLAQASHDLVPPDVLEPCVRTLANHFVNDRSSPEVMAVGLNAIREVCARAPLVMDRELLIDLAQYKKSKQKGVMMAARSLIALMRDVNPKLLDKKDRGKSASLELADGRTMLEFGANDIGIEDVADAEIIQEYLEMKGAAEQGKDGKSDGNDDWDHLQHAISDEDEGEDEDEDGDEEDFVMERLSGEDGIEAGDEGEQGGDEVDEEGVEEDAGKKKVSILGRVILTPKDLKGIALLKRQKAAEKGNKKSREDGSTLASKMSEIVDEDDIIGYVKKRRLTKEERIASILHGRDENNVAKKTAGLSNKEKMTSKPFMLTKHRDKVTSRRMLNVKQQGQRTTKHIKNLKMASKRVKKKLGRIATKRSKG